LRCTVTVTRILDSTRMLDSTHMLDSTRMLDSTNILDSPRILDSTRSTTNIPSHNHDLGINSHTMGTGTPIKRMVLGRLFMAQCQLQLRRSLPLLVRHLQFESGIGKFVD